MDTYTILRKEDKLVHYIEFTTGKILQVEMTLTSYVELESVDDELGIISTWAVLDDINREVNQFNITDKDTGEVLRVIPYEHHDDIYKRLFGSAYEVDTDRFYPF